MRARDVAKAGAPFWKIQRHRHGAANGGGGRLPGGGTGRG
jgi:hypothetical protein